MTKKKTTIQLNPEIGKAIVHETGEIMQEVIRGGAKIGDRFIQASLSSPYYSWATIALLTAMGVRAKLWSAETSDLITGTGLAILGVSEIEQSIPMLKGFVGTGMIDNKWDKSKVLSPWPLELSNNKDLDELLVRLEEQT